MKEGGITWMPDDKLEPLVKVPSCLGFRFLGLGVYIGFRGLVFRVGLWGFGALGL